MPATFAAIAPLCGAPHGISDYEAFANLPIWAAHNTNDAVVPSERTRETVAKIEAVNDVLFHRTSSVKTTDYENHQYIFTSGFHPVDSHNAWSELYYSVEFYQWLLRFERNQD